MAEQSGATYIIELTRIPMAMRYCGKLVDHRVLPAVVVYRLDDLWLLRRATLLRCGNLYAGRRNGSTDICTISGKSES